MGVALSSGQVQRSPAVIVPGDKRSVERDGQCHQMYLAPMSLPPPCRRLRAVTSPVVAEYIREVVVCWHVSYLHTMLEL